MPNRLALETSPYLLQHAGNPVDWHPWGDEAFARARTEDKPVLLSVGYAACHWCHVMAHESFEDTATAAAMNERFVCVKVDREERPDVDSIYMRAVQAFTGQGGWPMTVFLTPDGSPFYGGTYFPPEDRHGLPSFRRVLASVAEAWRTRRDEIAHAATAMLHIYDDAPASGRTPVTGSLLQRAVDATMRQYDGTHGGFGGAPKFPPTMTLDFLLRRWARTGDDALLQAVRHTWDHMMRGGLFDQLGGGWHRYSVDAEWLVPHFEKMLYDNALLLRLGAHLWQATGDPDVRAATEQTLSWAARELAAPDGGFYASLDADSEGHEGRYYVWSHAELGQVLGVDTEVLTAYWGAKTDGNFEGRNILWRPWPPDAFSASRALDRMMLDRIIERGRAALLAARERRVRPARDEKIVTSWNGLMLRGVAACARIFDEPRWKSLAVRTAEFLAQTVLCDGRVFRVFAGGEARIAGFLEDHAALGLGFLATYELTFDRRWLEHAYALADACERHFWDEATHAFFDAAADAPRLVTRPRDPYDNAIPSGTSLAVELLQRVAALEGDAARSARVSKVLSSLGAQMAQAPLAFGHLLGTADFEADGDVSVVLAGTPASPDFVQLERALAACYVPSLVLAGGVAAPPTVVKGKSPIDGHTAVYVCSGFRCATPTCEAATLVRQLAVAVRV